MLWMWVFDADDQSRLFKLSDAGSISGSAWAGMENCYMDSGSTRFTGFLYIDYVVFLLLHWNSIGKNMGDLPI